MRDLIRIQSSLSPGRALWDEVHGSEDREQKSQANYFLTLGGPTLLPGYYYFFLAPRFQMNSKFELWPDYQAMPAIVNARLMIWPTFLVRPRFISISSQTNSLLVRAFFARDFRSFHSSVTIFWHDFVRGIKSLITHAKKKPAIINETICEIAFGSSRRAWITAKKVSCVFPLITQVSEVRTRELTCTYITGPDEAHTMCGFCEILRP